MNNLFKKKAEKWFNFSTSAFDACRAILQIYDMFLLVSFKSDMKRYLIQTI